MKSIAIIGSGAIGGFYGAMLARSGLDVRFLMRSDLAAVRANGLRVVAPFGEFRIERPIAAATTEELGPVDLVIVAWKTTSNRALPRVLPPLLHERTLVLTLQNGLGAEEEIAAIVGAERTLGGLCFVGINRTEPGVIVNPVEGAVTLGEFGRPASARLKALVELFKSAGIKTRATDSLAEERWRKLVWNVPFNGLTIAAGGITTDRVLADEALRKLSRELMTEVLQGAAALGFSIPESYADFQMSRTPPLGAYKPSSLIDWQAGRELEVESIWGEPVRRAAAAGRALPRMEMLYVLLRALAARNASR
ncbi:MAG TPA: 2-dehydropantoate 2-reductase [Opitutaceae bacterium]|nr:2-dehydropantoate 2-reductase [Opitutaceae bacterium]